VLLVVSIFVTIPFMVFFVAALLGPCLLNLVLRLLILGPQLFAAFPLFCSPCCLSIRKKCSTSKRSIRFSFPRPSARAERVRFWSFNCPLPSLSNAPLFKRSSRKPPFFENSNTRALSSNPQPEENPRWPGICSCRFFSCFFLSRSPIHPFFRAAISSSVFLRSFLPPCEALPSICLCYPAAINLFFTKEEQTSPGRQRRRGMRVYSFPLCEC